MCALPIALSTFDAAAAASPVQPGVTTGGDQSDQNLAVAVQPVDNMPAAPDEQAPEADLAPAPAAPWWEAGSALPGIPDLANGFPALALRGA
ncbi:hypothetical protein EBN03_06095 [Nocardia stercoris]|uniref:Uncharacterized protein n=1 Tax=Nocardia stercoris TaxID=2483361 RepID=A0A3M2L9B1_9NOCA|nr:hypothetical protein EBN03_06095 [Nocardia stercoris]